MPFNDTAFEFWSASGGISMWILSAGVFVIILLLTFYALFKILNYAIKK